VESGVAAQTDGVDAIAGETPRGPIRAAGGLIVRADAHILLVHRPRFDDWSLPKGKLKRGEHPLAAAVREVQEETAVWGVPGIRLPSVSYPVPSGQSSVDKTVDWWAMTVAVPAPGSSPPDGFTPTDEVDGLAWWPIAEALEVLTYDRDRQVVRAYADLPPLSRPVVLVRHARAGDRHAWAGPDAARPLDPVGLEQAAALGRLLSLLRPGRLVSAQPLRCRQTLDALAREVGVEVEVEARFDEGTDPDTAAAALRSLAGETATVVCSQGGLIPAMVARLSARPEPEHVVEMGDALVLSFSGDTLVAADRLTPDPS
jgi:8-oxo-(d)GTP phosphatase